MPTERSLVPSLLLVGVLVLAPSGCAVLTPSPPQPSPRDSVVAQTVLQAVLVEYWTDVLKRRYDIALASGVPANTLPDVSQDARKADLRLAQRVSRGLDLIDVSALDQRNYLTTLALRWETEARAERAAFFLPDFSFFSPATSIVRNLTEIYRLQPLNSEGDTQRYLFFAEAMPFTLERIRSGLEERRERGYTAPREMVESAITFYGGLRDLGAEGPWSVTPERLARLDSAERRVVETELQEITTFRILPALDSLVNYLTATYLPAAAPRPGLWQYAGGKELYRHLLRRYSSLDVPPEEAHRVGLGELRRIDSTMAGLRRRQRWNPNPRAFHDSLRLAVGRAPSVWALIDGIIARETPLMAALPAHFSRVVAGHLAMRPATRAEALLWPDGAYLPATVVDSNATLLLTERWREPATGIVIASLTHRLTFPGRHLEATLTQGNFEIPPMRRLLDTPGFADGWAQYAAALAGEMGMYTDPLDAYGRLLDEGASMALLVVDTGIHYLGWSIPQAREVLGRYIVAPDTAIDSLLVERVVNDPGRGGAGALGAREIAGMRAWMQRDLGSHFDERSWHDEMLSLGELPLPIVGSHLEWWLYDVRRKAEAERVAQARAAAARADAERKAKAPPKKP